LSRDRFGRFGAGYPFDHGGDRHAQGKKPGPSVKKPKTYEALKDKGMSKERAAKISNAQAGKQKKNKNKNG
jgi:hypothetical protein